MRSVLITGGTGLLGKALLETAPAGWEVFATFHRNPPPVEWRFRFHPLDTCDETAVSDLFERLRPEVVVHTASIGSVDEAERFPDRVRQVNVIGTQNVGRVCHEIGARLVFISSNAVFDGEHPPYREGDPVRAANRYGELKIEAENRILQSGLSHLILRPILLYGWPFPGGRENAVTRWLACLERGQVVEVAQEITSMPLLATDCARAIWAALQQGRSGIYHLAGADRIPLMEFAREMAQIFGFSEDLVVPVSSQRWAHLAPRPPDTSFVTTKMIQELGVRPVGVREGLTILHRTRAMAV